MFYFSLSATKDLEFTNYTKKVFFMKNIQLMRLIYDKMSVSDLIHKLLNF